MVQRIRIRLGALVVKNLRANARNKKRCRVSLWVRKIACRRAWQSIPILLPGESHEQRSLAGCSPQGHKESDITAVCPHQCRDGLLWCEKIQEQLSSCTTTTKPVNLEPVLRNNRSRHDEKPVHCNRVPPPTLTRESPHSEKDPAQLK